MKKVDKFEQWYINTWGSNPEDTDESNKAFCAWQACKEEVLRILNNNRIVVYGEEIDTDAIDIDAIEEIKKL